MDTNLEVLLDQLDTQKSWSTDILKRMLAQSGVALPNNMKQFMGEVKEGDVFSVPQMGAHPAMVLRVNGDQCLSVLLSSKPGPYVAYKLTKTRFFLGSYVSYTLVVVPEGLVKARYLGSIDNPEELRASVRAVKSKLRQIWRENPRKQDIPAEFNEDFQEIP